MQISKRRAETGFTLIELMLSMTFLASILLFATLTFVQALNVYNKGLTIKQINETGRSLTADMRLATGGAGSFAISSAVGPPQFMCVGKTAYIWNIGNGSGGYVTGTTVYRFDGAGSEPINFVRTNEGVDARKLGYCREGFTEVQRAHVTSLIGNQAQVLEVDIVQPTSADDTDLDVPLVKISLTIGTKSGLSGGIDPIKSADSSYWHCPIDSGANFCAVGTYTTTIYLASGA